MITLRLPLGFCAAAALACALAAGPARAQDAWHRRDGLHGEPDWGPAHYGAACVGPALRGAPHYSSVDL